MARRKRRTHTVTVGGNRITLTRSIAGWVGVMQGQTLVVKEYGLLGWSVKAAKPGWSLSTGASVEGARSMSHGLEVMSMLLQKTRSRTNLNKRASDIAEALMGGGDG